MDSHGWAEVGALLAGLNRTGHPIDMDTLERIVAENNKQRYSFNGDHSKIRANQGHSIPVDLELEPRVPPKLLYHGTATCFLDRIRETGITRQSRQHVHLSSDANTARMVGSRHGKPVVLVIDAAAMARDGIPFYQSENSVWLCEMVPWKYVSEVEQL